MSKPPNRLANWKSTTLNPKIRIDNLNRAIPATSHRIKTALANGHNDEAEELTTTLNDMLKTLRDLDPHHPHLNTYRLALSTGRGVDA